MKTKQNLTTDFLPNEIPSDEDRQFAKELIFEVQHNLDVLDFEIANTESVLEALLKCHTEEATRKERLQALIAPHKLLPPEVPVRIFEEYLDGNPAPVLPTGSKSIPWVLGQVCSRWRDICLTQPHLWDSVSLCSRKNFPTLVLKEAFRRSDPRSIELDLIPADFAKYVLFGPTVRGSNLYLVFPSPALVSNSSESFPRLKD
ncbi:hypothetical protein BDZ94DRAFT_1310424 [Collybia nuda]|uniref:F-box domain-containing protein n=1 Tax=Collybia nuda TaxID=64659 RepID=A0A9P6CDD4_9AGAR|nr:hypothetical protein BDZ94DRAFT_1310424 [Collybia nuda]